MLPLFSFIIPSYKRADIICEALESIRLEQKQTGFNLEVLVADDGSEDNTKTVIEEWTNRHTIDWVHYDYLPVRKGVCAARNNGVERAKGDFLVFLDSDDQLLPGSLVHIKHRFEKTVELGIYYGAIKMKSGALGYLPEESFQERLLSFETFISLRGKGEYLHVCRRSIVEDATMRFRDDVNGFESILWMRALLKGAKLWIDPRPVRLYDDLRIDRLCHPLNLARDTSRLAHGFRVYFEEFGPIIKPYQPTYWSYLLLRVIFYNKVAGTWSKDLKEHLHDDITQASNKLKLLAIIPSACFRFLYPVINRLRNSKLVKAVNQL